MTLFAARQIKILDVLIQSHHAHYPLPGDLWLLLIARQITIIDAVQRWIERTDGGDRNLVGIQNLARSIQTVGLINPIQITDDNVLVSGLRRLLAHVYLVAQGHPQFNAIAAITVARQWTMRDHLAEAMERTDFTAVEMAGNLAMLLAELEQRPMTTSGFFAQRDGTIGVSPKLRAIVQCRRGGTGSGRRSRMSWDTLTGIGTII